MSTRKKIFLLIAGSLAMILIFSVVLYFSAAKLINADSVKEKLQAYLLGKTGAAVAYRISEIHLFPLPEIIFHQVNISISGKAHGSVESLRVYPGLWSLMKGKVWIAKLSLEAPHFTVNISEDREKPSLEQMEEKIRSAVHYLVSATPDLRIVIRDGKIDLTEEDRIAFFFDLIQSRLSASQKTLDIELACRSNLWENFSILSSIKADDLKSEGTIRLTHLHPNILIARLLKERALQIGVTDADVSVKFETSGLRMVKASMETSVPGLTISRGKRLVSMGDAKIKGDIGIEPDSVSVRIKEAKISQPALNLSGAYTLDRNSSMMTFDLQSKSIAVQPVRESALALGGDIPLIETIFTILRGGEISVLHVHSDGKFLTELGQMENIRISGRMRDGLIYVAARDLTFRNVTGDVVISRGILEGSNVAGSLEGHRCSGGKLRIGLKGKDAPFHIDMRVKADAGQVPSLLKHNRLVKNETVLREIDSLRELRGNAEGRLILGERLDSIHVKIAVDNMDIIARYEPLPFPLAVTGGQFFYDEKIVEIANMEGSLGSSSFSRLNARLNLTDPYDLEITDGQLSIFADEIYPWIASFEEIRSFLNDVRSVKGVVSVSSVNLQGPLHQPKEWNIHANGEAKNLTVDAAFLPGKAEDLSGTFAIILSELHLENMRFNILDSLLTVSGVIREFPSDIRAIDLTFKGNVGSDVLPWITTLAKIPPEIKLRAPVSVTDAGVLWEKGKKTTFDGRLLFGTETQVSLTVTKMPDALSIKNITVKDRVSDAAAEVMLNNDVIDAAFRGIVTPNTLKAIFAESIFSDVGLEGDIKTHIVVRNPNQSSAAGTLKGKNIPIPWDRAVPLFVKDIELKAEGQEVVIHTAQLTAGHMQFAAKGTVSVKPSWHAVDVDLSSDGIEWEALKSIFRDTDRKAGKENKGFLKDIPVRGTLRLRSDFFRYGQFTWEPFHTDITFDGKTVLLKIINAALCEVSSTGDLSITDQGIKLDIALVAQGLEFRPTILCLTNKHADYTGTFGMEARLKGEGPVDEIKDRLNGTFSISAKDGKIIKSESIDRTLDLLNESENLKGQFPDIEREVISYNVLDISGTIQGQKIQIQEGILDTSVMGITAQGYIDLSNETLDLNALVAPLKTVHRIVKKIPLLGHILGGNLVSVPVKLSGNLKDPNITFLSPSAVGSEILGILGRTIKLPVTLIEPVFPAKQ